MYIHLTDHFNLPIGIQIILIIPKLNLHYESESGSDIFSTFRISSGPCQSSWDNFYHLIRCHDYRVLGSFILQILLAPPVSLHRPTAVFEPRAWGHRTWTWKAASVGCRFSKKIN